MASEEEKLSRVSIIFPVGNVTSFTNEALRRLLEQTYQNIEIMVIDNSIDQDVQQQLADIHDPKVNLIKDNFTRGGGFARNRGIDEATGEFLAIVDCDDFVSKDHIEIGVRALNKCGADVYHCGYVNCYEDLQTKIARIPPKKLSFLKLMTYNPIGHSTVIMRSKLKPVYTKEKTRHDLRLWIELFQKKKVFYSNQQIKVDRNIVANSLSFSKVPLIVDHYRIYRASTSLSKLQISALILLLITRHIPLRLKLLILQFSKFLKNIIYTIT